MSIETDPFTNNTTDDTEALLASVRVAMEQPYVLSEPTPPQTEAPVVVIDREAADREQADWNAAIDYPNPDRLPISAVVKIMQAERAEREHAALERPLVPHTIRPGAVGAKINGYRERGLI